MCAVRPLSRKWKQFLTAARVGSFESSNGSNAIIAGGIK